MNYVDVSLHIIVALLTYLLFDAFAMELYLVYALMYFALSALLLHEWSLGLAEKLSIPTQNVLINLIGLLAFVPGGAYVANVRIDFWKAKITDINEAIVKGPDTYGYVLPNWDNIYSLDELQQLLADSLENVEFWESTLTTLNIAVEPFAWAFFIVSLSISGFLSLRNKRL